MALNLLDKLNPDSGSGRSSPSSFHHSPRHSPIMERVKKFISSPMGRRKNLDNNISDANKTFGVSLVHLVARTQDGSNIPYIVRKICDFIRQHGIRHEGIFRINGNARIVEKVKTSFDKTGDADLEEASDIMAVAGILKLFLREMPDSVIPEDLTRDYVALQEKYNGNRSSEEFSSKLRSMLEELPDMNYDLLKYLCSFLVLVSKEEDTNKMSPMALSIVFGPNLFKCSDGILGLKQQGTTNQIVFKFIKDYDLLFKSENEESPYTYGIIQVEEVKKSKTPPPRPPPPKFDHPPPDEPVPVPSPRKLHTKQQNPAVLISAPSIDMENHGNSNQSEDSRANTPIEGARSRSTSIQSQYTDEEQFDNRSASPFVLDSDGGSSVVTSPILSQVANELVTRTIQDTISEFMISSDDGDEEEEEEDTVDAKDTTSPVPAPRRKRQGNKSSDMANEEMIGSVKDKVKTFQSEETDGLPEVDQSDFVKPKRHRPTSTAFELFESQNILIGVAVDSGNIGRRKTSDAIEIPEDLDVDDKPLPKPRKKSDGSTSGKDEDLGLDEDTEILTTFKRPEGPKNRRTPTRKAMTEALRDHSNSKKEDINHNDSKESGAYKFLDIHQNGSASNSISPERSPNSGRKPFIPPLDLSTLHETLDGGDPVLAEHGPSLAYHKTLQDDEEALLSPRSQKLNKTKQSGGGTKQEDDQAVQIKLLTKKVQGLKKKIKTFEDNFETEHGYKPSQTDKAAKPEIKKYMTELNKARKDLKRVRDEVDNENLAKTFPGSFKESAGQTRTSSGKEEHKGLPSVNEEDTPKMEDTLNTLMKKLNDKRKDNSRPETLEDMTRDQVQHEKLAVQKALLHFEGIHGRPSTKSEKELMRPLYDRYRNIKKILAKPHSPKNKELETVPEGTTIEFTDAESQTKKEISVRVPLPSSDNDESDDLGTGEFNVTKDPGLFTNAAKENIQKSVDSGIDWGKDEDDADKGLRKTSSESNLHELSRSELLQQQKMTLNEKKTLRKILREFEEEFVSQHGRKVQKEDRVPMETEYNNYKKIKAKLKLMEALLTKHDPSSTI